MWWLQVKKNPCNVNNQPFFFSLKSNKVGLEKMTSACQGAVENVGIRPTYQKEIEITKRIFDEVKKDLVSGCVPGKLGIYCYEK